MSHGDSGRSHGESGRTGGMISREDGDLRRPKLRRRRSGEGGPPKRLGYQAMTGDWNIPAQVRLEDVGIAKSQWEMEGQAFGDRDPAGPGRYGVHESL